MIARERNTNSNHVIWMLYSRTNDMHIYLKRINVRIQQVTRSLIDQDWHGVSPIWNFRVFALSVYFNDCFWCTLYRLNLSVMQGRIFVMPRSQSLLILLNLRERDIESEKYYWIAYDIKSVKSNIENKSIIKEGTVVYKNLDYWESKFVHDNSCHVQSWILNILNFKF